MSNDCGVVIVDVVAIIGVSSGKTRCRDNLLEGYDKRRIAAEKRMQKAAAATQKNKKKKK